MYTAGPQIAGGSSEALERAEYLGTRCTANRPAATTRTRPATTADTLAPVGGGGAGGHPSLDPAH